ncbi:uncharacterized protein LOC129855855 isoform X2 [Salvelinus fontinalis]|uniref:uncharacterized protein LOC129855855 isoform X2 n=1 Tax=Salvelinus fontinalis TaxID=8038 RepID=UPI002485D845|nr:uncharacterized protein LOC129855855 isoform X2 [Salvelinus fontinalis]
MAETVLSLFDYREPPTLDSDGEGTKPAPTPRGRGCGRKRKGTPVKVCDRVFVTEDEEDSSEHSYCPGDGKEAAENKRPTLDGPCYINDPAQICGSLELGEEGSSGGRGAAVMYPPPPNCRIREVHCGSQVRLVVIAIRDITKGEEITVDYSLTEWGDNTMGFRGTVSPGRYECLSDPENNSIKKEEESVPPSLSAQDYLTPSWPLSPSSSPLSHSNASDSDPQNEVGEDGSQRRTPRRRKRRRTTTPSKKRTTPHRTSPGRPPLSTSYRPLTFSPPPSSSSTSSRPSLFKSPAPLGPNTTANISINIARGVGMGVPPQKLSCAYCGRHFRSLGRHLDKHHPNQPEIRAALIERFMPHLAAAHAAHHAQSEQQPRTSTASGAEQNSHKPPQGGAAAAALSLSPQRPSATTAQSPSSAVGRNSSPLVLTPPRGRSAVAVSVLKRSPPPVAVTPPRKAGLRKVKKEKEEEEENDLVEVEVVRPKEEAEAACPHVFQQTPKEVERLPKEDENEEEEEESGMMEDDSGAEEKEKELLSLGRLHMLPLLSSLSSLVLYLRRLQHSAFLSLSRQLQSAEAWRLLCHSSLALLILYNRRRECEVSKLVIAEYRARVTPQCPVPVPPGAPPALTPLEASLSPFERLVLPHLPRVGVQGKRGRVQPLILPPHCEPCLELLLQTRQDVGVDPQNPYVFARPYHSPATPLRGTDLLRSLARSSGTRNPRALTQTRVRRQVAILTQLLLLGEGEEPGQPGGYAIERLEHFLEREYHVTQSCGGIGQDPGLMGRVGRVVLCGERDGVLFRGMSLHHICLELDVMSGNSADSYSDGDSDGEGGKEKGEVAPPSLLMVRKGRTNGRTPRARKLKVTPSSALPLSPSLPGRRRGSGGPKSGKRGVLKRPWSDAERAAVEEHLTSNIAELRVPAKADCERCLQSCPLLVTNRRDWRAIKFYCHNRIQLLKKNQRREDDGTPIMVC